MYLPANFINIVNAGRVNVNRGDMVSKSVYPLKALSSPGDSSKII